MAHTGEPTGRKKIVRSNHELITFTWLWNTYLSEHNETNYNLVNRVFQFAFRCGGINVINWLKEHISRIQYQQLLSYAGPQLFEEAALFGHFKMFIWFWEQVELTTRKWPIVPTDYRFFSLIFFRKVSWYFDDTDFKLELSDKHEERYQILKDYSNVEFSEKSLEKMLHAANWIWQRMTSHQHAIMLSANDFQVFDEVIGLVTTNDDKAFNIFNWLYSHTSIQQKQALHDKYQNDILKSNFKIYNTFIKKIEEDNGLRTNPTRNQFQNKPSSCRPDLHY